MARKRANNEGSVFQDQDGTWWAQLPADEQGLRPRRRAKMQREAQQKLREMQREREALELLERVLEGEDEM
jgi:hypothetical protein